MDSSDGSNIASSIAMQQLPPKVPAPPSEKAQIALSPNLAYSTASPPKEGHTAMQQLPQVPAPHSGKEHITPSPNAAYGSMLGPEAEENLTDPGQLYEYIAPDVPQGSDSNVGPQPPLEREGEGAVGVVAGASFRMVGVAAHT